VDFFAVEFDDGAGADFADFAAGGYLDVDGVTGGKLGGADAIRDFYQSAGTFYKGEGKVGLGDDSGAGLDEDGLVDGGSADHWLGLILIDDTKLRQNVLCGKDNITEIIF